MTVTIEPASRKACAAPNPMLRYCLNRGSVNEVKGVYPDVPPSTTTFLLMSLSPELTIMNIV
jgi:hypothetical protein